MPYVICPICHDLFHLRINGNISVWEQQYVVDRTENGIPLLRCVRCWVELRVGHLVTVRNVHLAAIPLLQTGQQGYVASTRLINHHMVITVRFGEQHYDFRREDLFYVIGQPAVH